MGKKKHSRERRYARRHAEQKKSQTRSHEQEVVSAEQHPELSERANGNGNQKKGDPMTFRNFLKQPSFTDWLIAGFTLALVVVSACQFSAIDGQLTTMQGQLGAMEKQTGIMQRDQRSWIRIELSSPPFRADSAQVAVLHIINSGKIPAREIRAQFVIETVDPDTAPALNYAQPVTTFASGIIFPGGKPVDESVHRLRASSKGVNGPVVDEYPLAIPEIAKFNDKKLFFVAYGEIRYKDSFGDHWTHFCDFILSPAGGRYKGRTCTEYNAADNN